MIIKHEFLEELVKEYIDLLWVQVNVIKDKANIKTQVIRKDGLLRR